MFAINQVAYPQTLQNLEFDWHAYGQQTAQQGIAGIAASNEILADSLARHPDQPIRHGIGQGVLNIGQIAYQDPEAFRHNFEEKPLDAGKAMGKVFMDGYYKTRDDAQNMNQHPALHQVAPITHHPGIGGQTAIPPISAIILL